MTRETDYEKPGKFTCAIDECRKIFIELSMFWRLSLIGFVVLLGLGGSVLLWAQAIYQDDIKTMSSRISEIEAAFNDIQFIRSQSNEILENQNQIIKYLKITGKGR